MSDKRDLFNEEDIRRLYSAIRARIASDRALTALHIGADQTIVATGTDNKIAAVLVLPIGSEKTGLEFFHHAPPTPEEVEHAINVVEDEMSRANRMTAAESLLYTADNSIREIAHLADVPDRPEIVLNRDAVETLFSRLATLSMGYPAAKDDLRADASFSATLLILREFMHHLGFTSINVTW